MKISVVVAVYNPGRHIRPLVESLLRQSMPAEDFEIVFVDDGSTDETPPLLDQLAAEHANVRVVHQPNSGWPGKPRNVGIEAARGDYIFFSDHDDWFGDEALERLHACAARTNADIVIGKMVGHNRSVPRELFRRNRDRATFADAPLQDSLTPHKLFRRAFLLEHGLRFPEGKRRLEDHVFVLKAYFDADVISIVADYDCYHHVTRPDEANAGFRPIEPVSYYGYVREVADIALANTEPGPVRDQVLRRVLRVEILDRLQRRREFHDLEPKERRLLFDTARQLVVETMPTSVDDALPGRQRLIAAMLRSGDIAGTELLSVWPLPRRAEIRSAAWRDDALRVEWSAHIGHEGLLHLAGGRTYLVAPDGDDRSVHIDVTDDVAKVRIDLVAWDEQRGEIVVPTKMSAQVDGDGRIAVTGHAHLKVGAGVQALRAGMWTLRLRVRALGWTVDTGPLRWRRHVDAAFVGPDALLVRPAPTVLGWAGVDVAGASAWLDYGFARRCLGAADPAGARLMLPALTRSPERLRLRVGEQVVAVPVHERDEGPGCSEVILSAAAVREGGAVAVSTGGDRWVDLGLTVATTERGLRVRRPAAASARLGAMRSAWTVRRAFGAGRRVAERLARQMLRR